VESRDGTVVPGERENCAARAAWGRTLWASVGIVIVASVPIYELMTLYLNTTAMSHTWQAFEEATCHMRLGEHVTNQQDAVYMAQTL
jgi:hypothetical protein